MHDVKSFMYFSRPVAYVYFPFTIIGLLLKKKRNHVSILVKIPSPVVIIKGKIANNIKINASTEIRKGAHLTATPTLTFSF